MRSAIAGVALLAVLAACGGGGGGSSGSENAPVEAGARKITVDARNYEFDPGTIDVAAGEDVEIVLHSEDQRHDLTLEGKGLVVDVAGGKTASGGLRVARPGSYTFYCAIPGHRAAGMVGTLEVS
jgi:cytochrome c oxidase subunit 2